MATSGEVWIDRALVSWRQLSDSERSFVLRAAVVAPVTTASLTALGLERTLRWVAKTSRSQWVVSSRVPVSVERVSVERGAELVRRAMRATTGDGACLRRALVQCALHSMDGTGAILRIGVRRAAPEGTIPIDAHAWVDAPERAPSGENAAYAVLFERAFP